MAWAPEEEEYPLLDSVKTDPTVSVRESQTNIPEAPNAHNLYSFSPNMLLKIMLLLKCFIRIFSIIENFSLKTIRSINKKTVN